MERFNKADYRWQYPDLGEWLLCNIFYSGTFDTAPYHHKLLQNKQGLFITVI